MLDGSVRVQQPAADRTDLGILRQFEQAGQPVFADYLHVVVQQRQLLGPAHFQREVRLRRVVERHDRSGIILDPDAERAEARHLPGGQLAVIHHHDLVIAVAGATQDRVDKVVHHVELSTPGKFQSVVVGQDQQGHPRLAKQAPADAERAGQ